MKTASPVVGILMGSDSDWPHVEVTAATLAEFNVGCEVRVLSAHRSPAQVAEYAAGAIQRGLKVIIAAAGGSAHLAGVVAAHTTLPVIGIPIPGTSLSGLDSLLSIVQMPADVPVACVGVGGGGPKNAAILAVQILALADPALSKSLAKRKADLVSQIQAKDRRIADVAKRVRPKSKSAPRQ
jgi:5-(carboxyamino)imidazole ribonucleotide mutase